MAVKTYGSANSQARQILDFYGSANDQAQTVTKVYGQSPETGYIITGLRSGAIDLGRFNSMYYRTFGPFLQKPYEVSAINYTNNTVLVSVRTWAGEFINDLFSYPQGEYNNEGVIWGIDTEPVPSGSSVLTIALFDASSSVQPISRLIYQGFGHLDYSSSGYGRVVYYTDSSHTTTRTINLESQSDINGLCAQSVWDTTWNASVQGISIPNTNIKEVYLTSLVNSIPNNFLYRCTSLDNLDFSQTTITTTNPYFVNGCSSLNVPITIPQTLTTMLGGFLSNNASFNQPITLPSGLVSIGYNFFTGNDSMTSPINVGSLSESIILEDTYSSHSFNVNSPSAAYTNGIPIAGSNRAAWIARFPNLSGTWYRKLVDAGY